MRADNIIWLPAHGTHNVVPDNRCQLPIRFRATVTHGRCCRERAKFVRGSLMTIFPPLWPAAARLMFIAIGQPMNGQLLFIVNKQGGFCSSIQFDAMAASTVVGRDRPREMMDLLRLRCWRMVRFSLLVMKSFLVRTLASRREFTLDVVPLMLEPGIRSCRSPL